MKVTLVGVKNIEAFETNDGTTVLKRLYGIEKISVHFSVGSVSILHLMI